MSELGVPLWVWAATVGVIVLILGGELAAGARREPREVRIGGAALYVAAVLGLAVLFGLSLIWLGHPAAGSRFFAVWLTEYTLSLDNLFIFVLLIGSSAVRRELHSRVLLLGVAMALVLRGAFIAAGAAAISRFGWVLYFFGALLFYAAVRLVVGGRPERRAPGDGIVMHALQRVIHVGPDSGSGRLIVRSRGQLAVTPFLLLIVAVAGTDLMFALDSIPAIFGLTRDPYLIFASSAFALLGLRQLYFVIGGLLSRLVYLPAGLAAILAFIGVKLVTEALSGSGVVAIGPVPVPRFGPGLSLAVIGSVLVIATVASLLSGKQASGLSLARQEMAGARCAILPARSHQKRNDANPGSASRTARSRPRRDASHESSQPPNEAGWEYQYLDYSASAVAIRTLPGSRAGQHLSRRQWCSRWPHAVRRPPRCPRAIIGGRPTSPFSRGSCRWCVSPDSARCRATVGTKPPPGSRRECQT